MSVQCLDFTYRYTRPSDIADSEPDEPCVRLATSSVNSNPQFLDATLVDPVTFAESLLCLASIVRTHYFLPKAGLLDPVVTCGEGALRFEGFSGCVGVYVHAVFYESAFREPITGRGTTNIDINEPLRNGLARIRASQHVRLAIGTRQVAVQVDNQEYVEKKVSFRCVGFAVFAKFKPIYRKRRESHPCLSVSYSHSSAHCQETQLAQRPFGLLQRANRYGLLAESLTRRSALLERIDCVLSNRFCDMGRAK